MVPNIFPGGIWAITKGVYVPSQKVFGSIRVILGKYCCNVCLHIYIYTHSMSSIFDMIYTHKYIYVCVSPFFTPISSFHQVFGLFWYRSRRLFGVFQQALGHEVEVASDGEAVGDVS